MFCIFIGLVMYSLEKSNINTIVSMIKAVGRLLILSTLRGHLSIIILLKLGRFLQCANGIKMEYLPSTSKEKVEEEYERSLEDEICRGELTNALKYCYSLLQEKNLLTDKPPAKISSVSIAMGEVIYENIIDMLGERKVVTEDDLRLFDESDSESEGLFEEILAMFYDEIFEDERGEATCTLKVIPSKCTPLCQPCDVYFYRQIKNLLKRLQNAPTLLQEQREITSREDIIKIHSLISHQLSAPVFMPMIRYAWFASKLSNDRDIFLNVNEILQFLCITIKKKMCLRKNRIYKVCLVQDYPMFHLLLRSLPSSQL